MNAKMAALVTMAHTTVLARVETMRRRREAGQGTIEYVGLILLVGAALATAAYVVDGQLVQTVLDAVKNGINSGLEKLGVGGDGGGIFGF